ncbi:Tre-2/Bub2/Cdc16 (TBC) domain-containing protein B [Monocercomonoides exilis]|uniref:Tre-2/Bub2/Cdc16 (TBC) domain-containing protein B n=1 Tax=Monocercomonoides exilis TaxID=2049356 RepID=UPI003559A649|nr:Tre-2/Bub2/Cdc16 (TBC) domain-containing protein B [Monocercomonoides exilis]|eukprot:MONOS_4735.1-p1 / transcript=MONOS_4735.1 / gene=MONOS_4735 / organism=Monocercomonoides_exilis_PA203 / gene_product=Tre-2/Bub2/Cdc16 (TBC) domain-containing protein B / transcript_product=Tre-2/Bub2/Cdc16 (TBC) domain-containing protein B / location=Mono_scaffold00130:20324-22850(+) / protein_length=652 / sequence_SO=supercontig / SO=protein_coding / is_pseudo=false
MSSSKEDKLKFDRFGFKIEKNADLTPEQINKEVERTRKWRVMLDNWDKWVKSNPNKIKQRCAKGIPDCIRSSAWKKLVAFDELRASPKYRNINFYDLKDKPTEHREQIEKDLDRTFPDYTDLMGGNSVERVKLLHTLVAYAVFDPELGYCQSLSYLAGCLNMYYNAEDSFWMLVFMLNEGSYGIRKFYTTNFTLLVACMYVLERLLEKKIPSVYKKLRFLAANSTFFGDSDSSFIKRKPTKQQMQEKYKKCRLKPGRIVQPFADQWFWTIYLYTFPFSSAVRVWDCFFAGGRKVLYRFGIAFMKLLEPYLTTCPSYEELIMHIHHGAQEQKVDIEGLIKIAYGISLSRKEIKKLMTEYEATQEKKKKDKKESNSDKSVSSQTPSSSSSSSSSASVSVSPSSSSCTPSSFDRADSSGCSSSATPNPDASSEAPSFPARASLVGETPVPQMNGQSPFTPSPSPSPSDDFTSLPTPSSAYSSSASPNMTSSTSFVSSPLKYSDSALSPHSESMPSEDYLHPMGTEPLTLVQAANNENSESDEPFSNTLTFSSSSLDPPLPSTPPPPALSPLPATPVAPSSALSLPSDSPITLTPPPPPPSSSPSSSPSSLPTPLTTPPPIDTFSLPPSPPLPSLTPPLTPPPALDTPPPPPPEP